jgi:hypothetical protein
MKINFTQMGNGSCQELHTEILDTFEWDCTRIRLMVVQYFFCFRVKTEIMFIRVW